MSAGDVHPSPQSGSPLEQFIILAKNVHGNAASQLVSQALEAHGVYVFGELINLPNIQELSKSSETKPFWDALHLFAYGTYGDYLQQQASLPKFTEKQLNKLRQLTIVSFAEHQKHIRYETLLEQLGMHSLRQLEDLIIDAIYENIIQGKLDQSKQQLEIDHCMGRDVRPEDLPGLVNTLTEWCDQCQVMLSSLDEQMTQADKRKSQAIEKRQNMEKELEKVRKQAKVQTSGPGTSQMQMDDDLIPDVSSSSSPMPPDEKKRKTGNSKRHENDGRTSGQRCEGRNRQRVIQSEHIKNPAADYLIETRKKTENNPAAGYSIEAHKK